ncbi:MAG: hypothetical protein WC211_03840 [Dehalococcoidia bacterium]
MERGRTLTTNPGFTRAEALRVARVAVETGYPSLQAVAGLGLIARCLGRRGFAIWGMF